MKNNKNKRKITFDIVFVIITAFMFVGPNLVHAKSIEDTIKKSIDQFSDSLKNAVEEIGDDIEAVQNYLDNYHWKGIVQEKATSGVVTLKHLKLNGRGLAIAVKPGERVEGVVDCKFDAADCSSMKFYRVVIGIKNQGGQTTIGNSFGAIAGKSHEKFVLIAPSEPGLYQIRFRAVEALLEGTALADWVDKEGNEPDGTSTIGIIFVK